MRAVFTFLIAATLSLNVFSASMPTPIITFKFDKLEYLPSGKRLQTLGYKGSGRNLFGGKNLLYSVEII